MSISLIDTIRSVPDFPKKGIVFKDITTLLKNAEALEVALNRMTEHYKNSGVQKVVGIEARGFIFGGALACMLRAGFVPARKPGKLPAQRNRQEYALEYGTDAIELHSDAIEPGERVLMHDDLLATGGTMAAACRLVQASGGVIVGVSFLIELQFLGGRERLPGLDVHSLVKYESE